jgi:pentapeptide MXKDX repeat protein
MNTKMRSGLMFVAAIAISSIALAAPTFKFGKTDKANMMMGKNDVIEIAAYPKFPLLARNITAKSATLIYKGSDAHAPFAFYEAALIKDGWKSSDAMGKGDAMAGDAMAKGDAMRWPEKVTPWLETP